MKAASISEIKSSLKQMPQEDILEICLRLARFKKENKELLSFLLFEQDQLPVYLDAVKEEMDIDFAGMNKSNVYLAKKTIRKVLRNTNKHIRYTQSAEAEIELLLHFCTSLKSFQSTFQKSHSVTNLYQNQLKKIRAVLNTLHEDLQHDYESALKRLV
jgi:predicted PolB exonuclease-like 3'-5' exonuclease